MVHEIKIVLVSEQLNSWVSGRTNSVLANNEWLEDVAVQAQAVCQERHGSRYKPRESQRAKLIAQLRGTALSVIVEHRCRSPVRLADLMGLFVS